MSADLVADEIVDPLATESNYLTRSADAQHDRETLLEIWHGSLGPAHAHAAKFDWFYRDCPAGPPLVELLYCKSSGQAVGVAVAGVRRMLCEGREIRAGVLVDFAVRPAHRSLGPALQLQKALIASAGARFDLLYGFPNRKAVPVVRRVGYVALGEMVRHARVLRHGTHLERIMPRALAQPLGFIIDRMHAARRLWQRVRSTAVIAQWSDRADPRIDELWQHSTPDSGLVGLRDCAMLRWRFDELPGRTTRYLLLGEPGSDRLLAWFACEAVAGTLHVRDFWSIDGTCGMHRRFVEALVRAAYAAGHATLNVECAGSVLAFAGWRAAGFVERARQPVFGKWLQTQAVPLATTLHFTPLDEDE